MVSRIFRAEFAPDAKVSDAYPKWTDITPYVTSVEASMSGRSYELDAIRAGEATIRLDDADGRFTPGRTSLVLLSERFNALGGLGTSNRFGMDTGVWFVNSSGTGDTRTVASTPDGVSITTSSITSTGFLELKRAANAANDYIVKVTPGQQITLAFRARATNTDNTTRVLPVIYMEDAASATISTLTGSTVTSNGAWVDGVSTFTVPANTVSIRYAVKAEPTSTTGGQHTLEVAYLRVETPAPYAGKLKPRKPIRTYAVLDDNWLHYECVNVANLDDDAPRWWSVRSTPPTWRASNAAKGLVTWQDDTPLAKRVYHFATPGAGTGANYTFRSGLEGDTDVVHVRAGQTVSVDADIKLLTGTSVSLSISALAYDGVTYSQLGTSSTTTTVGTWVHCAVTATATTDCMVRMQFQAVNATGNRFKMANPKLRLDGVGSATADPAGGLYPHFRGFAERWSTRFDTKQASTEVHCVDALSVLGRPLKSFYRDRVRRWYDEKNAANPNNEMHYWTCVEGSDDAYAEPSIGTMRLLRVNSATPPAVGGFTTAKTMPNSDGATSGGFAVDDSTPGNGAVLRLTNYSQPVLPGTVNGGTAVAVDLWYKGDLPAPAELRQLFVSNSANGNVILGLSIGAEGWAKAGYSANGVLGALDQNINSPAGSIKKGVGHHIGVTVQATGPSGPTTLTLWVDGVVGASVTISQYNPHPPSAFTMFGGSLFRNISESFMRGTINHLVWASGPASLTFHQDIHQYGVDVSEGESERLSRILESIGWAGSATFDDSVSTLLPCRWDDGADANATLTDAAADAGGILIARKGGELVYHNRQRRIAAPIRWTVKEWSPGLTFDMDDGRVYNIVRAERSTGLYREKRDQASIDEYGPKKLTVRRDVLDPDEIAQAAGWLLHRYRTSAPRCDVLTIDASALTGANDGPLLALAHGVTVSDRTLLTALPEAAPGDELDFFVEGVKTSVVLDGPAIQWQTTLQISDYTDSVAWILEDAKTGVLDSDQCVAIY